MKATESDRMTEALNALSENVSRVSKAIAADASPGRDAAGGVVSSLTEAVMGVTEGLVRIANAIESLADAVRETRGES